MSLASLSMSRRVLESATIMTWVSLCVRLSTVVLILPLVLHRFDSAEVAVWLLFSTILTLVLLLDLGLGPTFSRLFSYALAGVKIERMADMRRAESNSPFSDGEEPKPNITRIFSALKWIYPRLAFFSVLLFSIAGTIALRGPIERCADQLSAWFAWVLVLAGAYFGLVGNASSVALQGLNEVAKQKRLDAIIGVAQVLSNFAVLLFHGSLLALVVSHQAWSIASAFANRMLLDKCFPFLQGVGASRDRRVLRVLWPATWRSGIGILMSHGLIQTSGLVYGQLASAEELASYLLAIRIITMVSQISQAPFYSKLPELARLHALGQVRQGLEIAQRGMRLAQAVLCAGVIGVALLSEHLLKFINSKTEFVSLPMWSLIALAFFVERFGAMHLQLYSVTNRIIWHIANGVTGVLMIAAAVGLYPHFGVLALPAAMFFAYALFYAPYAAIASSRTFGFSLWNFERRASIPSLLVMLCVLGTFSFVFRVSDFQ